MSEAYWNELSNYCEKHDQRYRRYLHACPICVGEELGKNPKLHINPPPFPVEMIPNKAGLFLVDKPATEPPRPKPARPQQLSLF